MYPPGGFDGRHALITTLLGGGLDNRIPGMGGLYTKSGGTQYVITFDEVEQNLGAVELMTDGAFTVRVGGLWVFTFGISTTAQNGGSTTAIKKNGTGVNAVASALITTAANVPMTMVVTTGRRSRKRVMCSTLSIPRSPRAPRRRGPVDLLRRSSRPAVSGNLDAGAARRFCFARG